MESDILAAVESEQYQAAAPRDKREYPTAWTPGVTCDGYSGTITTEPMESAPNDWAEILEVWGLDPDKYEIQEPVSFSAWDSLRGGEVVRLFSYKASIRLRSKYAIGFDYDDLVKEIKKFKPKPERPKGGESFVVCVADLQLGKKDGDGTLGTIRAFQQSVANIKQRVKELRRIGREIGTLYIVGLGDIIESCTDNYAQQLFTVELNLRDQLKVARRLIRDAIVELAPMFDTVVVSAVPGNHGEASRRGGKNVTDDADNHDVALFEVLAEVFAANPAFDHIRFLLPNDEMFVVLNISGINVCFAHGHRTKGGANPSQKQKSWWADMAFTEQPPGDASILVTAHYHHLIVVDHGPKIHIQCPALDGGSKWWADMGGGVSKRGILTFVIDENGHKDLEVM